MADKKPTAEDIKAAYAAWDDMGEFLHDQSKVVGLWYASDFSVSGNTLYYLDGDNDSQCIELDEFLDADLHKQRNAERAAARAQVQREAELQRAERELANARAIIARYENRHPNEDIES